MRAWALPLLRCLECSATALELRSADVRCPTCGTTYARREDVVDFLHRPHPTIVREREAVHRIDREAGAPPDWMRAVLGRLNRDELTSEDLASSEHIRAIAESRAQVLALFSEERLTPGSVVLEIGADVGWASSILLTHGCRVIATDITDHLFLAPDHQSPNLCRLFADMNRLPLADSAVDMVFAASCVHHSWDLGLTFREIARILKPGGTAYLCGEPLPSLLRYVAGGRFGHEERALGINENMDSPRCLAASLPGGRPRAADRVSKPERSPVERATAQAAAARFPQRPPASGDDDTTGLRPPAGGQREWLKRRRTVHASFN